ncbi:2-hydroxyacyl-CoA dehydratase subunit D [Chloroflexota bacterium]
MSSSLSFPNRLEAINLHKKDGGAVAAVLPIHYPRALLRAFNFLPVEVWGPPGIPAGLGGAHLQPYVCAIAHNALSFLLNDGLDTAELMVIPHTCDSLQGLASILIDFIKPKQPILPIYLPRGIRQSDQDYLAAELGAVYQRLVEITGRAPTNQQIMEHIYVEEQADKMLRSLHDAGPTLSLSDLERYSILRSREYLPPQDFIALAHQALVLKNDKPNTNIPLIISGILPEPMNVLQTLNELGASIGGDDLACCGRRLYPTGDSVDPFQRMAQSLLGAPPDPTRASSLQERCDYLVELVGKYNARGVLFYPVKFCEPELFDLPILRRELEKFHIPSIIVETEIDAVPSGQFVTRIEAFLEMIR